MNQMENYSNTHKLDKVDESLDELVDFFECVIVYLHVHIWNFLELSATCYFLKYRFLLNLLPSV